MSIIGLTRTRRETFAALKNSIITSLELIDYDFPSKIEHVIIKPNLCYYFDHTTGQTTDPRIVAATIGVIRDQLPADTTISIVESDASAMKCRYVYRMLGYERLARERNVRLVNLSEEPSRVVNTTVEGRTFRLNVPCEIDDADLRINMPKIKYTIESLGITCALKNVFGCNPYRKKFRYHPLLEETIIALNKAMRFNLCLVDGLTVSGVHPRKMGLVMAGEDCVAIDAAGSIIAGLNPHKINYLQLARKEGLGNTAFTPKGEPLDYFRSRYPKKTAKNKLMSKAYSMLTITGIGTRLGLTQ